MRGLLYDVLRHRFVAWLAVLLQTMLFLSVPIAVSQIQALVGLAPGNVITMHYIILILCFGICLQLLRLLTGSLWTSIGFHLAYLEIARFRHLVIWKWRSKNYNLPRYSARIRRGIYLYRYDCYWGHFCITCYTRCEAFHSEKCIIRTNSLSYMY